MTQQSAPTLRDINQRLLRAGLAQIPGSRLKEIISPQIRDRFLRSVYLAHQDAGAKRFVQQVLDAGGLPAPSTQPQPPAANDQHPAPPEQYEPDPGNTPAGEWGVSYHVYGGKAALCFNCDETKGKTPTISLDAASSTGPKSYDWKNKIRIQLTKQELPVVAAVLLGAQQRCEFKNHGKDNDKGFSMVRQEGGKLFVSVFAKGAPVKAVPIFQPDLLWVSALFISQLQKGCEGVDTSGVITLVRITQSG